MSATKLETMPALVPVERVTPFDVVVHPSVGAKTYGLPSGAANVGEHDAEAATTWNSASEPAIVQPDGSLILKRDGVKPMTAGKRSTYVVRDPQGALCMLRVGHQDPSRPEPKDSPVTTFTDPLHGWAPGGAPTPSASESESAPDDVAAEAIQGRRAILDLLKRGAITADEAAAMLAEV